MALTPPQKKKLDTLATKIKELNAFLAGANKALKDKPPTSDKEKKTRFESARMRHDAMHAAGQDVIMDKTLAVTNEAKAEIKKKVAATTEYGKYRKALG
jgi:hypothetical protein